MKKCCFFQDQLQNLSIVSAIFDQKFQNDLHRGQPLAVLCPNESIWHVCRVFRFLDYLVQKKFYLEKRQRFFNFFSSFLCSKKLRFMHTTISASECMWKARLPVGKMRCSKFHFDHLTLTYSIFHVNSYTFPEFSQTLYQQFSTLHSTLVVNYPSQASFEGNWMFFIAFLFLRAYWIVSAGPSGHLKQSVQKTVFEQRTTSTRLRASKWKKLCCNCPNIFLTSFL